MIRRALLPLWPALTHYFGVTPLNFGAFSHDELRGYIDAVRDAPPVGASVMVTGL